MCVLVDVFWGLASPTPADRARLYTEYPAGRVFMSWCMCTYVGLYIVFPVLSLISGRCRLRARRKYQEKRIMTCAFFMSFLGASVYLCILRSSIRVFLSFFLRLMIQFRERGKCHEGGVFMHVYSVPCFSFYLFICLPFSSFLSFRSRDIGNR